MKEEIIEIYKKMDKKSKEIKEIIPNLVKEGESAYNIAEIIEREIKKDFDLAFPVNISINEKTAHYSPSIFKDYIIPKEGVIKIDFGIMKEGYILDTALTLNLSGEYKDIISLNQEIFNILDEFLKEGVSLAEIGNKIQEFIEENKTREELKIIENLTGHFLGKYELHRGNIPNTKNNINIKLKEGDIIAIEPFLSLGSGFVYEDSSFCSIYKIKDFNHRNPLIREFISKIKYKELPFSDRWIKMDKNKIKLVLNLLKKENKIRCYYGLKDSDITTQTEYTYLILKDDNIRFG